MHVRELQSQHLPALVNTAFEHCNLLHSYGQSTLYSIAICLRFAVVGVLKGILAVALGFVLLGGMGPQGASKMGITGIAMNCAGGVW